MGPLSRGGSHIQLLKEVITEEASAGNRWLTSGGSRAGGDLDIVTERGHGTVVSLRLPLNPVTPN